MSDPRPFAQRSLVQLTLVRLREFLREPEAVFWAFLFPILLTLGLAVAFRNTTPEALRIGAASSELGTPLATESGLAVAVLDPVEGQARLTTGKILLYVSRGDDGTLKYRYDDTIPDARMARLLAERALARAGGGYQPPPGGDEIASEPGSRYVDFLVPGLLGMTLMGDSIWGVGFPIVDARRKKLLKRLLASPMSRAEYLLSFILSRFALLVVEVLLLVGFTALVFGVPVRGSLWELGLLVILSALAFSGLGLLIASRAQTLEGASGLMNFVMLPMWIFSGIFFSAERFPAALQPFIQALPLTAVIDALRGSMLQGLTLREMGLDIAIILSWLLVCFPLALKIFRWR